MPALSLKARFRWHRKLVKYDLLSRFKPDAHSRLVDVLRRSALDQRQNPAKNRHNLDLFFLYAHAANCAANLPRLERTLELGTGYSSVLLHRVRRPETRMFSIDGRPIDDYDIATPLLALRDEVDFINGFTITRAQMDGFYDGESRALFLDTPAATLREHLPAFIVPHGGPYAQALGLRPEAPDFVERCLGLLFEGDKVRCLKSLLPKIYEREAAFTQPEGASAMEGLLAEVEFFDYIFFDCGEFSSLVEWTLLKDRIRPGGLAVLHDIYFPKSTKNFLLAAAIAASEDWTVLHQDRTTPQGLLIAQKN